MTALRHGRMPRCSNCPVFGRRRLVQPQVTNGFRPVPARYSRRYSVGRALRDLGFRREVSCAGDSQAARFSGCEGMFQGTVSPGVERQPAGPSARTAGALPDGRTSARRKHRCGPRRIFVAQTEEPCRGHPLDQGKSDQTQAGLLAHGSSLDARPSQALHDLASGPVTGGAGRCAPAAHVHRARRLQLQGQPRDWKPGFRTAFPF